MWAQKKKITKVVEDDDNDEENDEDDDADTVSRSEMTSTTASTVYDELKDENAHNDDDVEILLNNDNVNNNNANDVNDYNDNNNNNKGKKKPLIKKKVKKVQPNKNINEKAKVQVGRRLKGATFETASRASTEVASTPATATTVSTPISQPTSTSSSDESSDSEDDDIIRSMRQAFDKLSLEEFMDFTNQINFNVNLNNYMGELKTPEGFRYSINNLPDKMKDVIAEDVPYEIPDRHIDPSRLPPPMDHDLYLHSEIKKKFGHRFVHLDETLQMIAEHYEDLKFTEDRVTEAFKAFDADGAGYLTYNQLRAACCVMGDPIDEDDFEEMFNIGDMEKSVQFFYEDVVIMNSPLWAREEPTAGMEDF